MVEARGGGRSGAPVKPSSGRDANGKVIPKPPSWERAAKRSLVPAGLLLVFIIVMNRKDENPINIAVLTIAAFVFYVPLSYAVDRWLYNSYVKKNGVPL